MSVDSLFFFLLLFSPPIRVEMGRGCRGRGGGGGRGEEGGVGVLGEYVQVTKASCFRMDT